MNYYLILLLLLLLYMTSCFVVSVFKKRNDIADIAWGLGFILMVWSAFILVADFSGRAIMVNSLVSIWGLRLAWHIYRRNKGKKEDYRYLAWREAWGKYFYLRSYLQVYLLQGFFLYLISLPVLLINIEGGAAWNVIDVLGISIWLLGFFFEAVGDRQLANFISQPANRGRLMQTGLWRYTRHPNYFGEVTQWWALWLIALNAPYAWLGIVGPLTISVLILKISGIPLLEKKMAENEEFKEYKKKTSIFFPLPVKK